VTAALGGHRRSPSKSPRRSQKPGDRLGADGQVVVAGARDQLYAEGARALESLAEERPPESAAAPSLADHECREVAWISPSDWSCTSAATAPPSTATTVVEPGAVRARRVRSGSAVYVSHPSADEQLHRPPEVLGAESAHLRAGCHGVGHLASSSRLGSIVALRARGGEVERNARNYVLCEPSCA